MACKVLYNTLKSLGVTAKVCHAYPVISVHNAPPCHQNSHTCLSKREANATGSFQKSNKTQQMNWNHVCQTARSLPNEKAHKRIMK